jgi:hypothetical protein
VREVDDDPERLADSTRSIRPGTTGTEASPRGPPPGRARPPRRAPRPRARCGR